MAGPAVDARAEHGIGHGDRGSIVAGAGQELNLLAMMMGMTMLTVVEHNLQKTFGRCCRGRCRQFVLNRLMAIVTAGMLGDDMDAVVLFDLFRGSLGEFRNIPILIVATRAVANRHLALPSHHVRMATHTVNVATNDFPMIHHDCAWLTGGRLMHDDLMRRFLVAPQAFAGFAIEGLVTEMTGEACLPFNEQMFFPRNVVGMAGGTGQAVKLFQTGFQVFQPSPGQGVGLDDCGPRFFEQSANLCVALDGRSYRNHRASESGISFVFTQDRFQPRNGLGKRFDSLLKATGHLQMLAMIEFNRGWTYTLDVLTIGGTRLGFRFAHPNGFMQVVPVSVALGSQTARIADVSTPPAGAGPAAEIAGHLRKPAELAAKGVLLAGGVVTFNAGDRELGTVGIVCPGLIIRLHDVTGAAERRPGSVAFNRYQPNRHYDHGDGQNENESLQPPSPTRLPACAPGIRHDRPRISGISLAGSLPGTGHDQCLPESKWRLRKTHESVWGGTANDREPHATDVARHAEVAMIAEVSLQDNRLDDDDGGFRWN